MRYVSACVLVVLLTDSVLRAGIGPQNTLVVVNADSFASKAVANEYVLRRNIPACNIVELHLNQLRDFEQVGVEDFRKLVLIPVLDQIRARGLAEQIDCIAYSSDVPYAVQVGADIGTQKLPLVITPVASLNGLTFLYQKVLARDIGYLKLDASRYAQRVIDHPPQTFTPAEHEKVGKAGALAREKKWAEAAGALSEVANAHPKAYEVSYDLACCLAQGGKADEAVAALTKAVDAGFWNAGLMQDDDDLNALKQRQDFKDLLRRIKPPPIVVRPSKGFSHSLDWSGQKHLLSTMLAVTSGRGNSVAEACEMIRRCVAADGSRPKGTLYYMLNGDIRSTTRRWGFQAAVDRLRAMGVSAEIVNGVLPKGKQDVAGAMVGIADFNWGTCGSAILPGGICEHLTSCGGIMVENGGQTPISAFIRAGAGGSSGTVTEPYAVQAKFPTPFIHLYYAQGATLAEAFYQSVAGPYQLLIIGDPVCRPWARIPTVSVSGIAPEEVVKGVVSLRPAVKPDDPPAARFELFVDGRRQAACPRGGELKLDTAKLSLGYHELRVIAVCADSLETQGQRVLPVYCNEVPRFSVALPQGSKAQWGQRCEISAEMAGVDRIELRCGGELVGTVAGSKGSAALDTQRLGMGMVLIHPVGFRSTGNIGVSVVSAKPFELTIEPPDVLKGKAVEAKTLAKGLLFRAADRTLTLDAGALPQALAKAAPKPNQPFTLEGYFDAPTQDLYQFQLRFSGKASFEVDSVALHRPATQGWSFIPVHLARGSHHLKAAFEPVGNTADLDLRFGNQGAQTVKAEQFKCPPR